MIEKNKQLCMLDITNTVTHLNEIVSYSHRVHSGNENLLSEIYGRKGKLQMGSSRGPRRKSMVLVSEDKVTWLSALIWSGL